MATKQVVRELVTLWGFDIDQKPLQEVEAGINVIKQSLKSLAVSLAASAAAVGILLNEAGADEQTRIAFETMLGSAEAMEEKLRELEDFAVRTPFTLKGIKASSKQLLAMNIEADKLLPTLKFLGDVSAGLSVPLSRLALNFGQVRNQNKLTGRELRDFAIAGVPLLDELAKNLGKTTSEIQKLISQGAISFPDVEAAFESMTSGSGRFADLMDKQSKSFFGILSNIQDVMQLLARDLGNELLPEAKRISKQFLDLITINKNLIRQNLSKFFKNMAEFMGLLFNMSVSLFKSVSGLVKVFGGWNTVLKVTGNLLTGIIGLGFVLGLGLMLQGVFKFTTGLRVMGNAALIAQAKLIAIPLAIGAIAIAIGLIAEDIFAFSEGRDSVFGRMIEGMDLAFETLQAKFGNFGIFLQLFLAGILTPVRIIVNGFRTIGTIIDVIQGKKSVLEGLTLANRNFLNTFDLARAAQTAGGIFGAARQVEAAGETIGAGADSAIKGLGTPFDTKGGGQKSISVSSKNEINLNLTGMDAETAKDLVTLTLGDELDAMLRAAVRDGESAIER